jgi:hypothetical protein
MGNPSGHTANFTGHQAVEAAITEEAEASITEEAVGTVGKDADAMAATVHHLKAVATVDRAGRRTEPARRSTPRVLDLSQCRPQCGAVLQPLQPRLQQQQALCPALPRQLQRQRRPT